MTKTILLVDDNEAVLLPIRRYFVQQGWTVWEVHEGREAYEVFGRESPDVVLLDLRLPGMGGLELLELFKRDDPDVAVVMLTGNADLETAVEAMRLGAENFLAKPIRLPHLSAAVDRALDTSRLRRQNRVLAGRGRRAGEQIHDRTLPGAVMAQVERLARTDSTVLLRGATGTGKTWLARLIHSISPRADRPFVDLNCAGLNATFLDSELFGHEKGAFTDAKTLKQGLMEVAHGGTLFLDEIGELAPEVQPKLLKVLETKRFRRLGGTREIEVDVRLVAATNRPLLEEVRAGRFREDLYYRMAVFPIELPALRDRPADEIVRLSYSVLADLQGRFGVQEVRIADAAMVALTRHDWPGNIRELRNVLERCMVNAEGAQLIEPGHLPPDILPAVAQGSDDSEEELVSLEEMERRHVRRVLRHCEGNRTRAAELLGISRRAIYDKIERLGLG